MNEVYDETETMFMIVGATMSLQEFIRATAKELQDGTWDGSRAEMHVIGDGRRRRWQGSERRGGREREKRLLVRKKSKKNSRESREEDGAQKWHQKEWVQKTVHWEEKQEKTAHVAERLPRQVEEERLEKMELAATSSAGVVKPTTVPYVDVEDVEESPCRAGSSSSQTTYQPK